jgi:hypothetical protein
VRALAIALLLATAPAHPPAPPAAGRPGPDDTLERSRARIAGELIRLGARIQREVETGDVAALVARVPPEGLRCAGQLVPRARVEKDLRAPTTWLHGVFFGNPGATGRPGAPASLRDFFATAKEVAVLVAFRRDPLAGPEGRPCLDFRSPGLITPGAPLCFEAKGGRWWFTESLYPCG